MSKKSSFTESKANIIGYAVAWFLGLLAIMGIIQAVWPKGRLHLVITAIVIALIIVIDKYYHPNHGEK